MKKNLKFTIFGNQEDKKGNSIPYHRTTQGSYWNAGSQRYLAWKNYVVKEFCKQTGVKDTSKKPILKSNDKIHVVMNIYFKDKTHADSDNIFKGIADSLFQNDKYVSGSFDFFYDANNPRVEVEIK